MEEKLITLQPDLKQHVCNVCYWVYDPAHNGGVAFKDLPEDWRCPICGVRKEEFDET